MADESKIRQALEEKGFEFPVMRDKDEKSVRLVGLQRSYGTPMTLVLDPKGIVRWHGFNGTPATAKEVEESLESLLESFYVPAIREFPPGLAACGNAYRSGKYSKAYSEATKALKKKNLSAEERDAAKRVIKNLERGVRRLLNESARSRERGYPSEGQKRLQTASRLFKGVPASKDARDRLRAWKKESAFKSELKAERALGKLKAALKNPKIDRRLIVKQLRNLATIYAEIPVAARIDTLIKELE